MVPIAGCLRMLMLLCPTLLSWLLQEIQKHPWFMQGLNPAALQFNDAIVAVGRVFSTLVPSRA